VLRQAVILAGGKGTRLAERLAGRPKPLVDVLGQPLLERQLQALRRDGIQRVLLLVNHEARQIQSFVDQRTSDGLAVELIDDGQPRGTAGAVLAILDRLDEEFLVVYGDTLFDVDLRRLIEFHAADAGAAATLFLHPNDHPADSDIVIVDDALRVRGFSAYPHPPGAWLPNMVNAALYAVRREALRPWAGPAIAVPRAADGTLDFAKHLFPAMVASGQPLRGYISPEYIKDVGTPKRLDDAARALAAGRVARASLREPQVAVFLDRDGCLNEARGHIAEPDALHVFDAAAPALNLLREHEFRRILVTNQPVVARGECSFERLAQIHGKLESTLGAQGAFLDRLLFCPHHPDRGFAGEVPQLKVRCECRKPAPGMLLRAAREMNVDLGRSWMVGDSTVDVLAARNAGVSSVLVRTGEGGRDGRHAVLPDFEARDVLDAARFIALVAPRIVADGAVQALLRAMTPGGDWLIGGQARSGKSTLASLLARELRGAGRDAVVIALDRWIRPEGSRAAGFEGRHDVDALRAAWQQATARHDGRTVSLPLPLYRRHDRTVIAHAETLALRPDTIVLWEGVAAGRLVDALRSPGSTVFVDTDAAARRDRVLADLVERGHTVDEASALWSQRLDDEVTLLAASARCFAHHLDLDAAWSGADPTGNER
jgi:histidinol-phosphate phosphatase family protein